MGRQLEAEAKQFQSDYEACISRQAQAKGPHGHNKKELNYNKESKN